MSREGVPKVMPMPPRQPEKSRGADAGSAMAELPDADIHNDTAMVAPSESPRPDERPATADTENICLSFPAQAPEIAKPCVQAACTLHGVPKPPGLPSRSADGHTGILIPGFP